MNNLKLLIPHLRGLLLLYLILVFYVAGLFYLVVDNACYRLQGLLLDFYGLAVL
jgi:hypothetical protein